MRRATHETKFVVRAVASSLGLFGLLRLPWTESHLVLPFTRMQASMAVRLFGAPASPVEATLACSGSDALALCLAAILSYPAPWRDRLTGAVGGTFLIVCLNTARIGTLGWAAASPSWFNALHVYVWPGLLAVAIFGYVFAWMRVADRRATLALITQPSRRFLILAALFLLAFLTTSSLYLESAGVLAVAGFIARSAAAMLGLAGVTAHASANVLWTTRGGFLVTQECLSTPLIPLYLAAVCAYARDWRRVALGVLAAVPLFTALGVIRLLMVAVPEAVMASPLFLVHSFYQLLLGAVLVFVAARWRHERKTASGHALTGVMVGVLCVYLLGPAYTRLVTSASAGLADDPQGALTFLPAFQIGLYLALWVAAFAAVSWRRVLGGLGLLSLSHAAGLFAWQTLAGHFDLVARAPQVRALAVAVPVFIVGAVVASVRTPR